MSNATTGAPRRNMPEALHLSLMLGLIAFFISLMLALVNAATAPIIEGNALRQRNESLAHMFPQAEDFVALALDPTELISGGYRAIQNNETAGLVLLSNPVGYGGTIQLSVGFDLEGRVVGLEFLSLSETSGIGSQVALESYWGQYIGKSEFSAVNAISGATVSSAAVRRGVAAAAEAAAQWLESGVIDPGVGAGQQAQLQAIFPDADELARSPVTGAGSVGTIYRAMRKGELEGLIVVAAPAGFKAPIEFAVGVNPEGRITSITFLTMNEAEGFGARITEEVFWSQFIGLTHVPEQGVDSISGATTSGNAVISGVREACALAGEFLELPATRQHEASALLFAEADAHLILRELAETDLVEAGRIVQRDNINIGYLILVRPMGRWGNIEMAVGFTMERAVTGVAILSMAEFPGVGDRIAEPDYLEQFTDLIDISELQGVDALTGATTSGEAVRQGVAAAMEALEETLS